MSNQITQEQAEQIIAGQREIKDLLAQLLGKRVTHVSESTAPGSMQELLQTGIARRERLQRNKLPQ